MTPGRPGRLTDPGDPDPGAPYAVPVAHLKAADPVMANLVERVGPCRLVLRDPGDLFPALVRSIVYQQLSGKAAATIHGRLLDRFGGEAPAPAVLLATPDADLRAVGLSRQKVAYVKDLAAQVLAELDLAALAREADEAFIAGLTGVKGIGRWTAQMVLIFWLGRPDVLPELDLGVRKAVMQAYGLAAMPSVKELRAIAEPWRPHASIASWYLWRSLDIETPGI